MESHRGRRIALAAGAVALAVLGLTAWRSWPHIRFWWLFEPLDLNARGCPEYRHRKTGIIFVRVPGGTFLMGSPEDEEGRSEDEPQHEVTLSPFLLGKYEVTQAQWKRAMGSTPRGLLGDDLPIWHLFWEDAQGFCRLSGLKLPTEAQWEYACRAGTRGPYAGTGNLQEMGWYVGNCRGQTQPVGQRRPNDFGLHDMHGNAEEWCGDVFDAGFYGKPEACAKDPLCTSGSEYRVSRGGFSYDRESGCRSAARRKRKLGPQNCAPGIRPAYYPLP